MVLLVDDDPVTLELYGTYLEGYCDQKVEICKDSRKVLPLLADKSASIILLDLNMPHLSGLELLIRIKEEHPDIPVVIVTGENDVGTAVDCMKRGAFDFMVKPVNRNRLFSVVRHALEMQELQREVSLLSSQFLSRGLRDPAAFAEIVTRNESMQSVFKYIEAVARSPKAVLITGESGTGKELVARAVHRVSVLEGEFVTVNVAGLDDNLFSDTLFGHKKGAFTGAESERKGLIERGSGGTLFLDEIGDLETGSQIKLLRLLQEEEFYPLGSDIAVRSRVRIIAATNSDLKAKQQEGSFRKDLYYRLMAHCIHIPPLRERMDDLPLLIDHFLEEAASSLQKKRPAYPTELIPYLSTYTFPGNIRELQSMVYDALSRHEKGVLSLSFFKEYMKEQRAEPGILPPTGPGCRISYSGPFPTLKETEDFLIHEALKMAEGNQSIAARLLGVSQSTLSRRLSGKTGA